MTEMTKKEMTLHALRGDAYSCAKDGMNIRGLRSQLEAYYIYQRGVTLEEFEEIIHEEHDKVWGKNAK